MTECIQCHWCHIISSEKSVANVTGTHMCALCTFNIQFDSKYFTQKKIQGKKNYSISFCFTLFLSVWLSGWNYFAWENVLSEKPGTECKSCACMYAWERIDEGREWVLVNSSHVSLFTVVLLVSLVRFSRRCGVAVNIQIEISLNNIVFGIFSSIGMALNVHAHWLTTRNERVEMSENERERFV